jgi:KaiC/GvpD/RAD55 family RecA-like ATPase
MAKKTTTKTLPKFQEIDLKKIKVFYRRSILESIMNILLMEQSGFRTYKSMKNLNRLFNSMDMTPYKSTPESYAYIWCIKAVSAQWLNGLTHRDLVIEAVKRQEGVDNIREGILERHRDHTELVPLSEAQTIFGLVQEALQMGAFSTYKDEYLSLLDGIDLDSPGAFKALAERLFMLSHSILDIKYNTNFVSNENEFNSDDEQSVLNALKEAIDSISASGSILKTGIKRLNTLLSPGYMNGRLYTYMGLPGSFKSIILLKSALDIKRYNPDLKPKTTGMKPTVLYITMENTFPETIERTWNLLFDDDMVNFSKEEALEKIQKELGLTVDSEGNNVAIVIKYYPYRTISTEDLYTIISDLKDNGQEVCALCLDYIKRIEPSVPSPESVKMELSRIVNELKALAVIENIPVITAHQLNRAAAAKVDSAIRDNKHDLAKLLGRENVGDAWEVIETSDWVCTLQVEFKKGTMEKYLGFNAVKRRRIDKSVDPGVRDITYMLHPFALNNGLRLIDDVNLDKILSLSSLETDIDEIVKPDKVNMVTRPKIKIKPFDDNYTKIA